MKMSTQIHQQGMVLVVALLFLLVMTVLGIGGIASSFMEEKMVGNSINRERAFQAAEAALRFVERDLASGTTKDTTMAAICASTTVAGDVCNRAYNVAGTKIKLVTDDLGDTCPAGFCTTSEQDFNYLDTAAHNCADANYIPDRWESCPTGTAAAGNNLNVFTTGSGKYQTYVEPLLTGVAQPPRYIIEFLGFRIPEGELSACDLDSDGFNETPNTSAFWPFCPNDLAYFRVTALGYGGTATTRVMLQSTVVIE